MSLVNDMLRNLEQRHAADAPLPNEVRPLPAEPAAAAWKPIAGGVLVLAIAGMGATVYLMKPDGETQVVPPQPVAARPVVPAPPPAAVPVSLPQPAAADPPATVPAAPAPPVAAVPESPTPTVAASIPAASEPPSNVVRQPPQADLKPRKPENKASAVENLKLETALLPSLDRVKSRTERTSAPVAPSPSATKPAVEASPEMKAEIDFRRAREMLAQGRRAEAEAAFSGGLAVIPQQADSAITLARLQVDRGDIAGAWATLQRSLPYAQQQANYRAFCGTVLQRLNRSGEAVAHYQAALRLNPAEGRWWIGLGLAHEGAGQVAEAREAFTRARATPGLPPELTSFAEQKLH